MVRNRLVLSIFPGIDLLGRAFEEVGFTTVRGPDPIFGGDIRKFVPPAGVFEGVIGGPPCQSHSSLAALSRHKGIEPSFPDMTPEYIRCVRAARPLWFLWENVRQAPPPTFDLKTDGYFVQEFLLNNRHVDRGDGIGPEQNRIRRFCFGCLEDVRIAPKFAAFDNPVKASAVLASELKSGAGIAGFIHARMKGVKPVSATRINRDWREMKILQGLPEEFELPGFTVEGKSKAVGNGVPLFLGRALAASVLKSVHGEDVK